MASPSKGWKLKVVSVWMGWLQFAAVDGCRFGEPARLAGNLAVLGTAGQSFLLVGVAMYPVPVRAGGQNVHGAVGVERRKVAGDGYVLGLPGDHDLIGAGGGERRHLGDRGSGVRRGPGVFVPQHVIVAAACVIVGVVSGVLVWLAPAVWLPVGAGIAVTGLSLRPQLWGRWRAPSPGKAAISAGQLLTSGHDQPSLSRSSDLHPVRQHHPGHGDGEYRSI